MTAEKRYFEEVLEDEQLPGFDINVTRTHIIKYVGAGGDFQPIHHDEEFAKAVGLPSIFANGLMHGGMLTRILTDWAGVDSVQRYKLRFGAIVWPGDTLTFAGKVAAKRIEDDNHLVDVSLTITNQNGENAITGEATVCFPARA